MAFYCISNVVQEIYRLKEMFGQMLNIGNILKIIIVVLYSVIVAFAILLQTNYFVILVLLFAPFAFILLIDKPFALFAILILSIPFSTTSLLDMHIMRVPGLKIINVLFVMTLFSFIHTKRFNKIRSDDKVFIIGMITFLSIALVRSTQYISLFSTLMGVHINVQTYFQSFLLKPLIIFSPFIYLLLLISDHQTLDRIFKVYIGSITLLSIFLLGLYMFHTPNKTDFESVRVSLSNIMNLHGNGLATILTVSFPLVLSYFFIKKNILSAISLILPVFAIGILYSRTAYLLIILSTIFYLVISKRFKLLPLIICLGVVLVFFIPNSMKDRAMTGLQAKNRNAISAGRIDNIWIPLINEISKSPRDILIGRGRFAILFSKAHKSGIMLRTGHAHNMYLGAVLDVGLIGLMFFLGFFLFYLKKFLIHTRKVYVSTENREILYGIIVSIIVFLFAGMTGRSFFPTITNYPIWFVLALGSVIIKLNKRTSYSCGDISK